MGLDMYFTARKSMTVFESSSDNSNQEKIIYPKQLKKLENYVDQIFGKSKTETVAYKIGYFRKFNALHNYIIEHFANGEDCCQEIYLSELDLQEMYDVCQKVINNPEKAEELLPTVDGFFFGSTEYNTDYFQDVKTAIEFLELAIPVASSSEYDIIYQASW